jgi:hypothetical protein
VVTWRHKSVRCSHHNTTLATSRVKQKTKTVKFPSNSDPPSHLFLKIVDKNVALLRRLPSTRNSLNCSPKPHDYLCATCRQICEKLKFCIYFTVNTPNKYGTAD